MVTPGPSLGASDEYHRRADKKRPAEAGLSWAFRRGGLEDDLDAAVLPLAHAVCGRHAQVALAAAADHHVGAGHAEPGQRIGDRVGAALGEALVVAGRARR